MSLTNKYQAKKCGNRTPKFRSDISIAFYVCFMFVCFLGNLTVSAQIELKLNEKQGFYPMGKKLSYLEDESRQLDFQSIQLPEFQGKFQVSNQEVPNFGYTDADFWFKMQVSRDSSFNDNWLLQMVHPLVDSLTVYFIQANTGKVLKKKLTGGWLPFASREFAHQTYIFTIPFEGNAPTIIYFHCKGWNSKQFPIQILTEKYLLEFTRLESIILGIYVGVFAAMVLYNFFLYLSLRSLSYLYYVLFMGGFVLMQLALGGHLNEFANEQWTLAITFSNLFFVGFSLFWGTQFARSFLRIKEYAPTIYFLLYIPDVLAVLLMSLSILALFYYDILYILPSLASFSAFSIAIVLLPTSIYIFLKGFRPARFYVLAWSALFVGIVIYVLRNSGYLPNNLFTTSAIRFGSLIEAILLSLGLADRINSIEKEKRQAQQKVIDTLQEKEHFISQQNRILEETVKKRTQEISEQNVLLGIQSYELTEALTELKFKNNEVISSINYAQRIQTAMLPQMEEIQNTFQKINAEVFVFFKPRDIVSGDFYWMLEKENKIVLAAVDCTGHGVPGSIMSMIGNDLLNEIVGFRGVLEADKILNLLHLGVRTALRQKDTNNNDGMDMSLVVIDKDTLQMEFAGACSSMLYVQNGQIQQVRGDRKSIGGVQREQERIFNKHTLQLVNQLAWQETTNDVQTMGMPNETAFYLFSDGYLDQMGGENQKKFMIKRFRDLIQEIHHKTIKEQHQIIQSTLENWMQTSSHKQIDDILVVGVKMNR